MRTRTNPSSLYQDIAESLAREIGEGVYPPRSKLPPERDMAERFGVSRPTIRRALGVLAQQGRISIRQGSGIYVREPFGRADQAAVVSVMSIFNNALLYRMQKALLRRGLMLCAYSTGEHGWDPETERLFLERVEREKHRALVAFCSPVKPHNSDVLARLHQAGTRVLHIEPYRMTLPEQEFLFFKYEDAGRLAAESFCDAGCAAFRYVHMGDAPYEQLLEKGFLSRVRQAGMAACCESYRFPPNWHTDSAARASIRAFLAQCPSNSGILCRSLDVAQGVRAVAGEDGRAKDMRIMSIAHERPSSPQPFRVLLFDRHEQIETAIARIASESQDCVREWIDPIEIHESPE